jgi:hypothetical protein
MSRPPRTSRRSARGLATLVGLAALLAAVAPGPARAFLRPAYEPGQRVEVKGLVTDPDGHPMANMDVTLELAREVFDFRHFHRKRVKVTPVAATTNDKGEFSIVFPWDDYYNRFDLTVSVPVRGPQGDQATELEREELTNKIDHGTPVVATVVVQNAAFVRNLRKFVASVDTPDERSVYQEMGRPDKVKISKYPDHEEVSWWYFASGKVYRFRAGKLLSTDTFDPVKDFPPK